MKSWWSWNAPFDRIGRVVVARCGGVAGHHQAIDQGLVVRRESVGRPAEILVPLRLGALIFRDGLEFLQARAGRNRLGFIHTVIISLFGKGGHHGTRAD